MSNKWQSFIFVLALALVGYWLINQGGILTIGGYIVIFFAIMGLIGWLTASRPKKTLSSRKGSGSPSTSSDSRIISKTRGQCKRV